MKWVIIFVIFEAIISQFAGSFVNTSLVNTTKDWNKDRQRKDDFAGWNYNLNLNNKYFHDIIHFLRGPILFESYFNLQQ